MSIEGVLQTLQGIDPWSIFTCLDTPYSKYSQFNYAASVQETPSIREIISQRKDQINGIDTIIKRMESLIDQFREKREQIVSSMKMHEGLVSCIRRLPPDVLKDIFIQCLPPSSQINESVHDPPILLTRICRGWREVAFDTGRLWSSLSIHGPVQRLSLFHDWLKNANDRPLSLHVDLVSSCRDSDSKDALWEFLQHYSCRITGLTVRFGESMANSLDRFLGDLPVLETLSLSGTSITNMHRTSTTQPYPRLRKLIISIPDFDITILPSVSLEWANLTYLAILLPYNFYADNHIFATLLATCPNLEHFAFCPLSTYSVHDEKPVRITHAKLRILSIVTCVLDGGWRMGSVSDPFSLTVTLPNLRYLHASDAEINPDTALEDITVPEGRLVDDPRHRVFNIAARDYEVTYMISPLCAMFNPGWKDLTHIRIHCHFSAANISRLLQLCPNLEDIVFYSIDIWQDPYTSFAHPTLRSLALVVHQGPLGILLDTFTLPNLCHLDLVLSEDSPDSKWPHRAFRKFLSRSQCPLETLKIKGEFIDDQEREEFLTLMPSLRRLELYDTTKSNVDEPSYSWTR